MQESIFVNVGLGVLCKLVEWLLVVSKIVVWLLVFLEVLGGCSWLLGWMVSFDY
jgi:hypothetical protein